MEQHPRCGAVPVSYTHLAPGENDLYMRTLKLGQVQENDFYSHILHDDLDSIVRDIREACLLYTSGVITEKR